MLFTTETALTDFARALGTRIKKYLNETPINQDSVRDSSVVADKNLDSANSVPNTAFVFELIGDVGAGKTTFTQALAEGLGVQVPVTSPTFTISNHYTLPNGGELIHYDFYRLDDPGIMAEDLAEALTQAHSVVVTEWGDHVADLLPESKLTLNFQILASGARELRAQTTSLFNQNLLRATGYLDDSWQS